MPTEAVHPHFSREERTDPMTGHTIEDTDGHYWIQEGDPDDGITVYFDSESSARDYAAIQVERPEQGLSRSLTNDFDESYDEG